ncbi:MAG: aspartate--tRNA ligase [Patescibacteria group bacterium]
MQRILANDIVQHEGKDITLKGWVSVRRDHGKIIFIDLRDRSGIVQCVFTKITPDVEKLRPEWVIKITGTVNKRPEKMINPHLPNGHHEVLVKELEILNEAQTLPISIDTDGYEIGEESRLKYRYLDLRRARLQKNLRMRYAVNEFIRNHLTKQDFIEIETPIISKSTPEGARDYLIPSRIYNGKFYALPQSPQQYKQLFMVSGLERYFQIARCFRDEDTRGDRQPEFTQLDLEISFAEREDVMDLIEDLYIKMVEVLFPEHKITQKPFSRLSHAEAIKKYNSDKPDLRKNKDDKFELAFCWIIDFPFFEEVKKEGGASHSEALAKEWTFTHNPFSKPKDEHMDMLMEKKNIDKILTTQYDLALNGYEIGGGSIRNFKPEALKRVFEIMGMSEERIKSNFGHMIEAFSYGAPPEGGIAMGLDRFMAIVMNEPNIREVIAFPKTGDGRDLMMEAPSEVDKKQLDELGLSIKKNKKSAK